MKLTTIVAVSVFALSGAVLATSAQARIGSATGNQEAQPDAPPPPEHRGQRRHHGGQGQHSPQGPGYQAPQVPQAPAPAPYQPRYGGGGNPGAYPPGGYHRQRPPGPPPQYGAGHAPAPYPGHGWDRDRRRDWDRKRRRERFRDGAAVVLGLGVLGALAQPRYSDPYHGYDYPPPPPPPQPGYAPYADDESPYDPYEPGDPYAGGYGPQPGGVIRCSSNEYRTTWCAIPNGARAQIRRRLSSATCDYGRDWGLAPNAIWVANGCRAEFSVY